MGMSCSDFIDQYAEGLETYNLGTLLNSFSLPFIVVYKEPQFVVNYQQQLENKLKGILFELDKQGIAGFKAHIDKQLQLDSNLFFVTVSWQLFNDNQDLIKENKTSYMLKWDQGFKIVTITFDDDDHTLRGLI